MEVNTRHILLALIASCSTLWAFQGAYLGGSLGGHLAEGAQAGNAAGTYNNSESYPIDLQQNLFDPNIAGMLYVGYGMGWRSLYLAAEGFIQFGCIRLTAQNTNLWTDNFPQVSQTSTISTGNLNCCQGGIDFLPGWIPNPATLLYGRVGLGVANVKLSLASTSSVIHGAERGFVSLFTSDNQTTVNFRAGGGIEQILTKHLSLRSDYTYTDYGSVSTQGSIAGLTSADLGITIADSTKLHIYDHAVLIGLNYRFCGQESIYLDPCCIASGYQGIFVIGHGGRVRNFRQQSRCRG